MFEPVHGSAPDIAGQGIANPIGTIWAGAMLVQHLGYQDVHDTIMDAVEEVLKEGKCLTADMGGRASTSELGRSVAEAIS
jgi:tartrate dehydrogenase/decarboxylase/D-malate dehydrogenase